MMRMAEPRIVKSTTNNLTLYRTEQPVAVLAVIPAAVLADDPVVIQERADGVGEIEAAVRETGIALGVVPLEFHGVM